ncbi:hypothetical protein IGI04_026994 [Brassica rapa subsp. trilocularis]|uniref:Uncharacterized protein n=1 Tax=Brassica rapa subsp. trilocularis TaxID=1813537 RepID=A0ABQ7KYS9_BRACM|nr:hypothetical protein IGI04_026994 [Brassica rapa subsp. trilocularis]
MWIIKQQDLKMKERVSKMRLLERLLAKEEPLADYEEALKKQLSIEMDRLKIMVHCKVWTSHRRVYCGRVTDLKSHGCLILSFTDLCCVVLSTLLLSCVV